MEDFYFSEVEELELEEKKAELERILSKPLPAEYERYGKEVLKDYLSLIKKYQKFKEETKNPFNYRKPTLEEQKIKKLLKDQLPLKFVINLGEKKSGQSLNCVIKNWRIARDRKFNPNK